MFEVSKVASIPVSGPVHVTPERDKQFISYYINSRILVPLVCSGNSAVKIYLQNIAKLCIPSLLTLSTVLSSKSCVTLAVVGVIIIITSSITSTG